MAIPVIDIFAGPGGLGEGFSSVVNKKGDRAFKIHLSIEKEYFAHQTLTLRSFFRQFDIGNVPDEYYLFIQGKISIDDLYTKWPKEARIAKNEAWKATLGEGSKDTPASEVDEKISESLKGKKNWVLIGGPPCQAYSIVGRSRRQEKILDASKDDRVELYKQYLRILAVHNPAIFVMENVKGLLSAETKESPVFRKILKDLSNPVLAVHAEDLDNRRKLECPGYKIYSIVESATNFDNQGNPILDPTSFLIRSEDYGIPQTRHRVILIGVRSDLTIIPEVLTPMPEVSVRNVISGLPRLRSGLSKTADSDHKWLEIIGKVKKNGLLTGIDKDTRKEIEKQLRQIRIPQNATGGEFISSTTCKPVYRPDWFYDKKIGGTINHSTRGHMESDLHRYFFISSFAKIWRQSPKLEHFPQNLLPAHKNVTEGIDKSKFSDRFRVQLWHKPSKTITSHISKDGHYYIHPDPTQCRSFTVREAARIQTFPDNYFFCGPRTAQFTQVGNAVPPLLAYQIATLIFKSLKGIDK